MESASLIIGLFLSLVAGVLLGKLGASIGWPVIQSMAVLGGNVVGIFSGEWKGAGRKPFVTMLFGLTLLVVGILVISRAGSL
jgi:L-rhamnose-H+ transport protein